MDELEEDAIGPIIADTIADRHQDDQPAMAARSSGHRGDRGEKVLPG